MEQKNEKQAPKTTNVVKGTKKARLPLPCTAVFG
jgi:hypothetical protein